LSHVLAAPFCTMFLADLGAEVIHVEPPRGDDARDFGPFAGEPGKDRSGYFISINRNKKSLVIDLKNEAGKEILTALIERSDVVVENFKPTTMKKLGFGWDRIQEINPRIIYASICGFGHDCLPAYSARPAYDIVAQAYSGLMSITGPTDGQPCRVGSSIGDIVSGHQAAIGILAALYNREKTGRGQYYDGSMVDGLFSVLENAVARFCINEEVPGPLGDAHPSVTPFQGFSTKGGGRIIIAVGNDSLWGKFCRVLEREELIEDPRFVTNPLRTANREELVVLLASELKQRSREEWGPLLDEAGVPYAPINDVKEICEDPHIAYRNMLVDIDQPGVGPMKITGSSIRLSETPGEVYAPAPRLGEHSEEILREILEMKPEDIAALKEQQVIYSMET
jgi:CoA:oxalate CoA-transferase